MTEPHCIHLLRAERELLAECHRHRSYLTVCGELLATEDLPSSECEVGCEREVVYCVACLHTANERNHDAGVIVRTQW